MENEERCSIFFIIVLCATVENLVPHGPWTPFARDHIFMNAYARGDTTLDHAAPMNVWKLIASSVRIGQMMYSQAG
jgi:hypothetical protein